jgi:voltage-gated potassium channel
MSTGSMLSTTAKRLLYGFLALALVTVGGGLGYYLIGGGRWAFLDCVYMTVITVTTVGYGEVLDGMNLVPYARGFTILLLVFGTGSIVFFASTITAFIIEGDLKNALFTSKLKKRMRRMKDHIVVCGAGSTGRNVIEELIAAKVPVIAIDTREGELKEIAESNPKANFSYLVGDATDDELLAQTNFGEARGLVAALSSDKDNLYLTVSARQANPTVRIIARCAELSHIEKLKKSGADAVVSPNFIGGMRMVSELLRPAVVRFLDDMLRDRRAAYRIEEVTIGSATELGETVREARIHERFGMTLLALRGKEDPVWTYNPGEAEKLRPGMTLVVLGSTEQVAALREKTA